MCWNLWVLISSFNLDWMWSVDGAGDDNCFNWGKVQMIIFADRLKGFERSPPTQNFNSNYYEVCINNCKIFSSNFMKSDQHTSCSFVNWICLNHFNSWIFSKNVSFYLKFQNLKAIHYQLIFLLNWKNYCLMVTMYKKFLNPTKIIF